MVVYLAITKTIQVNIELLVRQYLYQYKTISYPGIGRLTFSADIQLPESVEKGETVLLQGLHFTFNLQEQLDRDFVAYVSAQTGKIQSLAAADIESYFMLHKQFVNIGKSFTVEGIGSIDKLDDGTYIFTPGYFMTANEGSSAPLKPLKIREAQPIIPKNNNIQATPINKKMIKVAIGIIVTILMIWLIWYLVFVKNRDNSGIPTAIDTTKKANAGLISKPDTINANFKAIIEYRYTRAGATERVKKLRILGHNAHVDSVQPDLFRIYIPVKDTTVSVDSLQLSRITGKRPRFESL